jgi:hypothetical protein
LAILCSSRELVVGRFKIGAIASIATIAAALVVLSKSFTFAASADRKGLQFTVLSGLKGKRLMTGMTKLEANNKILGRNVVYWHAGEFCLVQDEFGLSAALNACMGLFSFASPKNCHFLEES